MVEVLGYILVAAQTTYVNLNVGAMGVLRGFG